MPISINRMPNSIYQLVYLSFANFDIGDKDVVSDILKSSTLNNSRLNVTGILFYKDGTAKYYNNSAFPLDMHSFSQAVFTLLKVGGKEEDIKFCKKVVDKSISALYLQSRNRFAYQRNRFYTNSVNYSRWTQAWSYYSLAFFIRTIKLKDTT